ncbi:MAG: hypothetical protein K2I87_00855, partial [Bacteroidales bacterium]|nr:hypothetical protein [Bacteroidales bacterium]
MFGFLSLCIVFLWSGAPADSLFQFSEQSLWERREEHLEDLLETAPEAYEEALAELQEYAEHPVNLNTARAE